MRGYPQRKPSEPRVLLRQSAAGYHAARAGVKGAEAEIHQMAQWVARSLEGQYIIENVVLVAAALVIGATVRGGRPTAEPAATRRRLDDEGVIE